MKYYVYVSETKVDMLFSQIPQRTRDKIATELKFDLKLFSATFKEEANKDTLYSKLEVVVKDIENNMTVGTVDDAESYFKGHMLLKWIDFSERRKGDWPCFFGGRTNETIFGMGGSMHHIIGNKNVSPSPAFFSTPNTLLSAIREGAKLFENEQNINPNTLLDMLLSNSVENQEMEIWRQLIIIVTRMRGVEQRLEFFGKKLLEGTYDKRRVLLGTPLYVALAD